MSTPIGKIPKEQLDELFDAIPQDATRIGSVDVGKVGWREFANQFLPEKFRLPGTEEVKEFKAKEKIRSKIPLEIESIRPSNVREAEVKRESLVDQLFDSGVKESMSTYEPTLYEKFVPEEIRSLIRPSTKTKESTIGRGAELAKDVIVDPTNLIEGPSGIVAGGSAFTSKLYSRLDKAIDTFNQPRGTGKQWLAHLSKGVPEQEAGHLKDILTEESNTVFTKEQIMELKDYKKPVVSEVYMGAEPTPKIRNIKVESPSRVIVGEFEFVKVPPSGNWQMYDSEGTYMGQFQDINAATSFAKNLPNETIKSKWNLYLKDKQRAEDYSEIVLTYPNKKNVFKSESHWEGIENPISHLRMTTREALYSPENNVTNILNKAGLESGGIPIKVRQIDELQSDWAQAIRRKGIRPSTIDEMPEVDLSQGDIIRYGKGKYKINYSSTGYPLDITPSDGFIRHVPLYSSMEDVENIEQAKKYVQWYIKGHDYVTRMPNQPFAKTDQWVDLSLERALQDAIDRNIDILTWSTGKNQYDIYGSELVRWERNSKRLKEIEIMELLKKHPNSANSNYDEIVNTWTAEELRNMIKFDVGITEEFIDDLIDMRNKSTGSHGIRINLKKQHRGYIPEIGSLEDLSIQRGMQYDETVIATKEEDLIEPLEQILQYPEDAPGQAKKLWERMQKEQTGQTLPRLEGMEYFYDTMIPRRMKEIGKKIGINLELVDIEVPYGKETVKQKGVKITPELIEKIKESGWPILGLIGTSGAAVSVENNKKERNSMDDLFD